MPENQDSLMIDHILEVISPYSKQKFTGKIEISLPSQERIAVYLNLGFIAWVSDGVNSQRRWKRYLKQAGLTAETMQIISRIINIEIQVSESEAGWEYDILVAIAKQNLLNKKQVYSVISFLAQEILFDFSQQGEKQVNKDNNFPFSVEFYQGIRPSDKQFLPHTWLCHFSKIAEKTKYTYQQWMALGLSQYSPDLIPIISDYKRLANKVKPDQYQKLVILFNGKYSLREIATRMQRDLITIAKPLSSLIKEEIIICAKTEIGSHSSSEKITSSFPKKTKPKTTSLEIVAIDDSPQALKIINSLITEAGHHCQQISNPINALPALLQDPPDLIFLDLIMPVINGYELCRKIRKMEALQNIPVIILSGNLINRFRARLVGATDALEKPIVNYQVVNLLSYYQQQKNQASPESHPEAS